jgi:hypothetical protein
MRYRGGSVIALPYLSTHSRDWRPPDFRGSSQAASYRYACWVRAGSVLKGLFSCIHSTLSDLNNRPAENPSLLQRHACFLDL